MEFEKVTRHLAFLLETAGATRNGTGSGADAVQVDFGLADILCLVGYFVVVLGVGLGASFLISRKAKKQPDSADDFFLAGRSMTWPAIGMSTWASNVGAPSVMGISGSAAAAGIAVTIYEWHGLLMLLALGWIFMPVYIAAQTTTMPQYLKKRFGGERLTIYFATLLIVLSVITGIPMELYAGVLFVRQILPGVNIYLIIVGILGITGVYSIIGGLGAIIYTDMLQVVVIIFGTFYIAIQSLVEIGGFDNLWDQFMTNATSQYTRDNNLACGYPPHDALHLMRSASDESFPWTGMIFGLTINAGFYWCSNQVIVQRSLSAKNMFHAKAGAIFAGYLKLLPFVIFVIPGMIARVKFPEAIACSNPEDCDAICRNKAGCTNIAYVLLVMALPTGIKGIVMAALLAALMSSLTANFNSCSSLFTMDIYSKFRKNRTQKELILVGRICILVMVCMAVAWIPIIEAVQGATLWDYMQTLISCFTPPIFAIFVMGVFFTRTTEKGAFFGMLIGNVVGVTKLILEFVYAPPVCGSGVPDTRPKVVTAVPYITFSFVLFAISVFAITVISFLTPPPSEEQLRNSTFWTRDKVAKADKKIDKKWDHVLNANAITAAAVCIFLWAWMA